MSDYGLEPNQVYHGDCLEIMADIADGSIDMILADLPYGTTACSWDSIIPLEPLWAHYKRIIKSTGAIVLTADEPFTSILIVNNLDWFKYKWVWKKTLAANFMNAKLRPLQKHEDVIIFSPGTTANRSKNNMTYNPQGIRKVDQKWSRPQAYPSEHKLTRPSHKLNRVIEYTGYPESVIEFSNGNNNNAHPTQKPVALMAYLIRTYTNPGELVLDNVIGSGTTAIAAIETGRNWIGIEMLPDPNRPIDPIDNPDYYSIATKRIEERMKQPFLPGIAEGQSGNEAPVKQPTLWEVTT